MLDQTLYRRHTTTFLMAVCRSKPHAYPSAELDRSLRALAGRSTSHRLVERAADLASPRNNAPLIVPLVDKGTRTIDSCESHWSWQAASEKLKNGNDATHDENKSPTTASL